MQQKCKNQKIGVVDLGVTSVKMFIFHSCYWGNFAGNHTDNVEEMINYLVGTDSDRTMDLKHSPFAWSLLEYYYLIISLD